MAEARQMSDQRTHDMRRAWQRIMVTPPRSRLTRYAVEIWWRLAELEVADKVAAGPEFERDSYRRAGLEYWRKT